MSEPKTNSFFWLPASAMAAVALTSLIVACASLSADAMLNAPPVAADTSTPAATASR